jgi:hypothetical protein
MSFVPLKTIQGFSLSELRDLIQKRDVYIWGAGFIGRGLRRRLESHGFNVKAFLDINPDLKTREGLNVYRPADFLPNIKNKNAFLIVLVANQSKLVEKQCLESGLEKNRDFILYHQAPRQMSVIEVSGACNYICTVCTKEDAHSNSAPYMKYQLYKKVLEKLLTECPLLTTVDLSLWCEPLHNPDIAAIIKETEKTVPCRLFTKLQDDNYLEDAVKSSPSQLTVIASGYEDSYNRNCKGASWPLFLSNLKKIKDYKKKYGVETEVSIMYILYTNNLQDFDKMKELGASLGFKVFSDNSYLSPYDNFMDLCEGKELNAELVDMRNKSSLDLDKVLELTRRDAGNPCIVQRIFPIINHDLSVSICHLFCKPIVAGNFLELPYDKIIEKRHTFEYCKKCQQYGLQRLDVEILRKRYPNEGI